jgi:iron(III) transport system ATP-binding protein
MTASATPTLLELRSVRQTYGDHEVVKGLSFSLVRGGIACLLGPSGCGKTTVLRCIAGFEPVTAGEIALNGQVVSSPGSMVPP